MTTMKLLQPDPASLNAALSATPAGMAWVMGSGPTGTTCGGCLRWAGRVKAEHHHKTGKLKAAPCERYTQLMRRNVVEIVGEKVEPTNASCRDFEPNPEPPADIPPVIEGSNIRDTTVRGLRVTFKRRPGSDHGDVVHTASGCSLLGDLRGMKVGRRAFVARVNASRLAEVDWDETDLPLGADLVALAIEARAQIEAAP